MGRLTRNYIRPGVISQLDLYYSIYRMQRGSAALCLGPYAKSMEKAKIRPPVKYEPLKLSP